MPAAQKPNCRGFQQSHILEVGALCLLVEEVCGVHPPDGVVVLADGIHERAILTEALERDALRAMPEMRCLPAIGEPPSPRSLEAKCRPCGHHAVFWDDEESAAVGDHSREVAG